MKVKKLLSVVLCLVLVLALLPVGAAAVGKSVSICGQALTSSTPYYANGGNALQTEPSSSSWNAYFDAANNTLHLKGLDVSTTSQPLAITVTGVSTLYIELEGGNTVATTHSDATSYGISAGLTNLVINGSGSLTVTAESGVGISANSIKLQYPAQLIVKGTTMATDKKIQYSGGEYAAPNAEGGQPISTYFSDANVYETTPYVSFTPKTDAQFNVWVGGIKVTSANMANVLNDSKVSYAIAHGSTPATLTLNGATINIISNVGTFAEAGIIATGEPLHILLKGANLIDVTKSSSSSKGCGVYSEKALTITADVGASLAANAVISAGGSGTAYAIYADGGVTLDNCEITDPTGTTWESNNKYILASGDTPTGYVTIGRPAPPPPQPVIISPTTYILNFEENGGAETANLVRTAGSAVDLASYVPTRDGYTFTGWYADKELTKPVATVALNGNTTVYAGWKWVNPFTDVTENDWFYSDVEYALAHGVFKGVTETAFEPENAMTRAMLVSVLYRLEGEPTIMFVRAPDKVFGDVPDGIWYEKAVQWAQLNGIVEGFDGSFAPNEPVTREQLAAILYRYAMYKGYDVSVGEDTNILSYSDAFGISEYAIPAIQWTCGAGLMEGDGENLMPQRGASRSQTAAILHRFCENAAVK